MKNLLLDTNAYVRLLSGDERVLAALGDAEIVHLSAIVMGELFSGFRGGTRYQENKSQLALFLSKPTVQELHVTAETAEIFGQIKDELKKAGNPIPLNDVWIASHAIETGSVVVSFDEHFRKVPGLRLWDVLE